MAINALEYAKIFNTKLKITESQRIYEEHTNGQKGGQNQEKEMLHIQNAIPINFFNQGSAMVAKQANCHIRETGEQNDVQSRLTSKKQVKMLAQVKFASADP